MSEIFLSHTSAFSFYRKRPYLDWKNEIGSKNMPNNISRSQLLYAGLDEFVDAKNQVHILVKNKTFQHVTKGFNLHYCLNLRKNFFAAANRNFYVCRPELVFIQLAAYLPPKKLFIAGIEMCSKYYIEDHEIKECTPVTTPEEILNFCAFLSKHNIRIRGLKTAKKWAAKIKENSASPLETHLFTKICAPREIGGYGLKDMSFNTPIKLSVPAAKICDQPIIVPDISNRKTKTALEYDSEQWHNSTHQNRKDKLRYDALTYDGWKVFSFVDVQMHNMAAFDAMAKMILTANKQDARIRCKDFEDNRQKLWDIFQ